MAIANVGSADGGNNGGTTNSLTYAYTVGTGSNRLLVVAVDGDVGGGADDVTGVTYAGAAMTLAKKSSTPTPNRVTYLYYLLNPTSGSNNVVISATTNHYLISVCAEYTGVRQTGQPDATASQTAVVGTTSQTTSITTVADNSWAILAEQGYSGGSFPSAGTGDTRRITDAATGNISIFDSAADIHPAGSYSMTTTRPSAVVITHLIGSFAPATGAGGALTGTSAASTTVSGTLTGSGALTGTSAATSTVTGTLSGTGALTGTSSATSTVTGTLSNANVFSGTSAAVSTATATLKGIGALIGSAPSLSSMTGIINGGAPRAIITSSVIIPPPLASIPAQILRLEDWPI